MSAQTELKNIMALYNEKFKDKEKASIIEEETENGYNLTFKISEINKYTISLSTDTDKKYMNCKKLYGFKQTGYTYLLGMLAERFVLEISKKDTTLKGKWNNAKSNPPEEGGRYWCYVEEIGELGLSHFEWNCYYDKELNEFRDNHEVMKVTHWTELMGQPK